jgi:hypothetical protein
MHVRCFTYIPSAAGGYFRLKQGVEGGAYPTRYVTTERRRMSRKEPRPRGLRRRGLIGGVGGGGGGGGGRRHEPGRGHG